MSRHDFGADPDEAPEGHEPNPEWAVAVRQGKKGADRPPKYIPTVTRRTAAAPAPAIVSESLTATQNEVAREHMAHGMSRAEAVAAALPAVETVAHMATREIEQSTQRPEAPPALTLVGPTTAAPVFSTRPPKGKKGKRGAAEAPAAPPVAWPEGVPWGPGVSARTLLLTDPRMAQIRDQVQAETAEQVTADNAAIEAEIQAQSTPAASAARAARKAREAEWEKAVAESIARTTPKERSEIEIINTDLREAILEIESNARIMNALRAELIEKGVEPPPIPVIGSAIPCPPCPVPTGGAVESDAATYRRLLDEALTALRAAPAAHAVAQPAPIYAAQAPAPQYAPSAPPAPAQAACASPRQRLQAEAERLMAQAQHTPHGDARDHMVARVAAIGQLIADRGLNLDGMPYRCATPHLGGKAPRGGTARAYARDAVAFLARGECALAQHHLQDAIEAAGPRPSRTLRARLGKIAKRIGKKCKITRR